MLHIRQEQIEVFAAATEEEFRRRLLDYVRRLFAPRYAAVGEADVIAAIDGGIERAKAHGLTTEREIAEFVDLIFALGPGFDEQTWARDILGTKADPGVKLAQLRKAQQHPPGGK